MNGSRFSGKVGFQFLPNPAVDPENYEFEVEELEGIIDEGLQGDPLRVLTGDDRDFHLSLSESFTVYRDVWVFPLSLLALVYAGP